jgi:hypothetical protein
MRRLTLALAVLGIVASAFVLAGCQTRAQEGALVGGGLGAGAGAIIGSTTGHAAGGAVIGGAIGAASGAVIGDQQDQRNRRQAPPPRDRGHYENRIVQTPSGETHEERVWVPDR